jgi:prephenate dehydrogenase
MTVEVAIIGLGQIGSSIGLSLAEKTDIVHRVGFDLDGDVAREAKKRGALDVLARDLPSVVKDAGLIILSLPTDQIRETLEVIAPHLKESSVVMDTAPVKETILAWARELLPEGRHYVGLTPVINPAYLQEHESGINAAHADLFKGGMMIIVAPADTPSDAVKLAADLARLLGANTLFADPLEVDSMMAATHIMPQLMAAALINITVDQPGWREGARIAGRAYSEVTGPIIQLGEPGALSSAAMMSRENVVRITGSLIAALQALRTDLENEDSESLTEKLERARLGRDAWWKKRQVTEVGPELASSNMNMPKTSDSFGQLLGFGRRTKKK